ncbi:DUF2975 domain-containing protein [Apilactobacillus micheneri]|uniref:DUF2975 domain-containing protein n=2 Tax=Apilactobacillus micheneri TaxID=1899430 RepID=A0ABY2YYY0_9LACO|nr:DUF2975 domain-containing protein [Apilactobacillus micheneri]TPR27064.1 DUF2975 domain-containing protein [Apilactobacillus micheneri]TPR27922.1 DUF2975 domain-containing protein [Apilactobacillus micheneri]TPR31827.1 DUF2975 domain-containing protein [Apilactobacillus micheneri]TPR32231.1 DUF2975 domain-containing protein [Apilactobacillus micheneri]
MEFMEALNKIVFKISQVLIQLILIMLYFFEVVFLIGLISFIIIGLNIDNKGSINYANSSLPMNIGIKAPIIIFLIMLMIVTLIMICRFLKKIIKNLKVKQYFIENNAVYIRNILYSFMIFIIINIILNILTSVKKLFNITDIFGLGKPSIINYVIYFVILITIYIIYNIFRYGIKVQNDSDSVI